MIGIRIGRLSRSRRKSLGECRVEQSDFLRLVAEKLDRLGIPYAVTGSMACIVYGEPRQTNDIDVVVKIGLDRSRVMRRLCAAGILCES